MCRSHSEDYATALADRRAAATEGYLNPAVPLMKRTSEDVELCTARDSATENPLGDNKSKLGRPDRRQDNRCSLPASTDLDRPAKPKLTRSQHRQSLKRLRLDAIRPVTPQADTHNADTAQNGIQRRPSSPKATLPKAEASQRPSRKRTNPSNLAQGSNKKGRFPQKGNPRRQQSTKPPSPQGGRGDNTRNDNSRQQNNAMNNRVPRQAIHSPVHRLSLPSAAITLRFPLNRPNKKAQSIPLPYFASTRRCPPSSIQTQKRRQWPRGRFRLSVADAKLTRLTSLGFFTDFIISRLDASVRLHPRQAFVVRMSCMRAKERAKSALNHFDERRLDRPLALQAHSVDPRGSPKASPFSSMITVTDRVVQSQCEYGSRTRRPSCANLAFGPVNKVRRPSTYSTTSASLSR